MHVPRTITTSLQMDDRGTGRIGLFDEALVHPIRGMIVPSIRPICIAGTLTRFGFLRRPSIAEGVADEQFSGEAPGAD